MMIRFQWKWQATCICFKLCFPYGIMRSIKLLNCILHTLCHVNVCHKKKINTIHHSLNSSNFFAVCECFRRNSHCAIQYTNAITLLLNRFGPCHISLRYQGNTCIQLFHSHAIFFCLGGLSKVKKKKLFNRNFLLWKCKLINFMSITDSLKYYEYYIEISIFIRNSKKLTDVIVNID